MTATLTRQQVSAYLDELASRVSGWDAAVVRQAVLVTGLRGPFSANQFRELLPEVAQGAVGLVIRQLPTQKHGALIRKAVTAEGYPKTEPSSAASTHGKPLQVWELTPAGRAAALALVVGEVAA